MVYIYLPLVAKWNLFEMSTLFHRCTCVSPDHRTRKFTTMYFHIGTQWVKVNHEGKYVVALMFCWINNLETRPPHSWNVPVVFDLFKKFHSKSQIRSHVDLLCTLHNSDKQCHVQLRSCVNTRHREDTAGQYQPLTESSLWVSICYKMTESREIGSPC